MFDDLQQFFVSHGQTSQVERSRTGVRGDRGWRETGFLTIIWMLTVYLVKKPGFCETRAIGYAGSSWERGRVKGDRSQ
ncbi:MAG: hypothetical protein KME42_11030 [Tildeniella nuda ZEHNDER 1965/U140]|nr:hypothetical protein [Tildeniella nuda ZEHNDER 1965/U140]